MAGLLMVLGCAVAFGVGLVRVHRAAQSAADLSALAAARAVATGGHGCDSASRIATANHAELVSCDVLGPTVTVRVRMAGPRWGGFHPDLSAVARAGPG
jgi:secretion/DNA translocation related TadE-like protein